MLVVKSVGLNLFSLLGLLLQAVWMPVRLCAVILYLYLTLNFVISSLIVGIFKSIQGVSRL